MGVIVRKNFVRISDVAFTTREDMREVGVLLIKRIKERTGRGVDARGAAFAPYSEAYAKRKPGGTSRVNLYASGGMLNAMTIVDVTDRSVSIGFSGGEAD